MLKKQTHLQILQRLDKERRIKILNTFYRKDMKRKTICLHFNPKDYLSTQSSNNQDSDNKNQTLPMPISEQKATVLVRPKRKKCKSISHNANPQQGRQASASQMKSLGQHSNSEKKASWFTRQEERKARPEQYGQQKNYQSKNNFQDEKAPLKENQSHNRKEQYVDMLNSAEERRGSLDISLEILGKRKSIRLREDKSRKNTPNVNFSQTIRTSVQSSPLYFMGEGECSSGMDKTLKRNYHKEFLKITRINHNLMPVSTSNRDSRKIKQRVKEHIRDIQPEQTQRQIKSCLLTRRIPEQPNRMESPILRRQKKINRVQKSAFTNDIQGWAVMPQQEQEFMSQYN